MRIKSKLSVSFATTWLLFVLMAGGVGYLFNKQAETVENTVASATMGVSVLEDMLMQLEKTRRYEKEYFIYIGDSAKKKKYVKAWDESINKVLEKVAVLKEDKDDLFSDVEQMLFVRWDDALRFYQTEFNQIVASYKDENYVGEKADNASRQWTITANTAIKEGKNALKVIFLDATGIEERKEALLLWGREQMVDQSRQMSYLLIASVIASAFFLLLIMSNLRQSILGNLHNIIQKLHSVNQGNHSVDFIATGVDELDELSVVAGQLRNKLLNK